MLLFPSAIFFLQRHRGVTAAVKQCAKMDEWEVQWMQRQAALESLFGKSSDHVLHAVYPFDLGGQADVLVFPNHYGGTLYVTADLTGETSGQPGNKNWAKYELAIAHRGNQGWGPKAISRLARYTIDTPLLPGETMDIGSAVPQPSEIAAFLFEKYGEFFLGGQSCGVLLCVGITAEELSACFEVGSAAVLQELRRNGVFPFTDLDRGNVWPGVA